MENGVPAVHNVKVIVRVHALSGIRYLKLYLSYQKYTALDLIINIHSVRSGKVHSKIISVGDRIPYIYTGIRIIF